MGNGRHHKIFARLAEMKNLARPADNDYEELDRHCSASTCPTSSDAWNGELN
jgi:hypothetical protein